MKLNRTAHRLASPLGQIRPGVAPGRQDVYTGAFVSNSHLLERPVCATAPHWTTCAGKTSTCWSSGFLGRTIAGRLHYYRTVRRCMPRYGTLLLADLAAWRSPSCSRFSHRPPPARCRGRSFPRSTLTPELGSRRLYAGCRLGSKQVPPRLVPSLSADSVLTSVKVILDASSAGLLSFAFLVHT